MPGASVRNPTRDKGHEEAGLTYAKAGSGLRGPPGLSQASTPKAESVCLTALCLSPTFLTLIGGYPPPPFSEKS